MQPGDVDGTGALLAGRDVQLNLSADATNSGTIAGRNLVQLNAANIQNMGGTRSGRMQALAGANAAMNLKQAADALKAGQGDANGMVKTGAQNPDGTPKTNADGTPETAQGNAADKAGGIGISISVGSSSSQSKQSSSADNARGSTLTAGGNVTIQATGDGQSSNLTVQGSSIQAGQTTTLKADNQVNLLAAQNTTSESSSNQSKSGSVGVAIQLGAGGGGMGFTASASKATGQGAGNGVTYNNTQVAGNTVNIESGGDTTLKGATVKATQVTADVGGNTMGLTNATQQNVDLWNQTGGNVTLDGHSRGGMTVGNALDAVKEQGGKGGATNVNLFGSAYNAQDAANTLNQITDGKGQVKQSTNNYDLIGRILGGNAGTGGTIPEGSSVLEEAIRTLGGAATVHNCYGTGKAECSDRFGKDYVAPPLVPVLPSDVGGKKP
jgi:hypothetical protein